MFIACFTRALLLGATFFWESVLQLHGKSVVVDSYMFFKALTILLHIMVGKKNL
jgi:hypothetical protein